jgi:hypothetical protein
MNTGDINTRHDGEEPQAPSKLVAALKELPARRVFVPPLIDEQVLRAAQRQLNGPQRAGFNWRRSWIVRPALAAACVVVVGIGYVMLSPKENGGFAREDFNRDGHVDILDAFQLSRELQNNEKSPAGFDLNGDGAVDQRDANVIAEQAVQLAKGRPS